jgi:predicted nucleic acid-binding protein
LKIYFDTSVLVPMWIEDTRSETVERWLETLADAPVVSDWALAEFTSALGIRRRIGAIDQAACERAEHALDQWVESGVERLVLVAADLVTARHLMRVDAVVVTAPDALHLALARRSGTALATLDEPLRRAAEALGIAVLPN